MAEKIPLPENSVTLFERRAHCCAQYAGRLYYWGGIVLITYRMPDESSSEDDSESDSDEEETPFTSVAGIPPGVLRVRKSLPLTDEKLIDVYDIKEKLWYQYRTAGEVPPPDYGTAMCERNGYIYLFGGYNDFNFSSDLYRLNLSNLTWKKMAVSTDTSPSPVYCTALIPYMSHLIAFGGICGVVPEEKQRTSGSAYHEYETLPRPHGCNNEYHEFSLDSCEFCSCSLVELDTLPIYDGIH